MSTQLGKYRLVRRLGAGGMGEVWEAVDTVLDRAVAVKLLHGGAAGESDELVQEAAAAAKVSHPNAVAVFDAVEADGRWFLVMEYVAGKSAGARVAEAGKLPWEEATRIARDAAAGLAAVHAAGLIHRDVKPANVLLTPDGVAKLADFGLARRAVRSGLTAGSQVVGTPHYMSPEQCWSESADGRSDVYSLGATYFTLLTGRTPYDAANDMAVMYAHCNAEVPDPRDRMPDVPAACAAVVRRAMAKQPPDRYPSADALRAALDQVLSGSLIPAPAPTPALLPPPTRAAAPVTRGRFTRRALLAAVPVSAVAVGLAAYLWPKADPPDGGGNGNGTDGSRGWVRQWTFPTSVANLAVAPDGQRVAVSLAGRQEATKDGVELRLRDGTPIAGWPRPGAGADGVAFSPDGARLAVAFRTSESLVVWGRESVRNDDYELAVPMAGACAVAFSDNGEWLAAGAFSTTGSRFHFWRAAEGGKWEKKHEFGAPECTVWGIGFAPGTTQLVAAVAGTRENPDATAIRTFDPIQGKEVPGPGLQPIRGEHGPALAFSRNPVRVAVGSKGGIRVYDLPNWNAVGNEIPVRQNGQPVAPWVIALSPDGRWLAATANDNTTGSDDVFLWEAATGQLKATIRKHLGQVFALAFTPDAADLLTGGEDAQVLVHDVAELTR